MIMTSTDRAGGRRLGWLPNALTVARIAACPVVVGLGLVLGERASWAIVGVLVAAGVTDWLDGWLARALGAESELGRMLDPIADKLLVATVLFMLAAADRLGPWEQLPALVIILRELFVSGLREYLGGMGIALPVSRLGKWKTAIQMGSVGLAVVATPGGPVPAFAAGATASLWLAAALTVASGWDYLRRGLSPSVGPGGAGVRAVRRQ